MPMDQPTLGDELERRLELVADLLDRGFTQAQVVKFVSSHNSELNWNISDRQVRNYVYEVQRRFEAEAVTINRPREYVASLRKYEYLYRKAVAKDDIKNAIDALNRRDKLLHLDNPSYMPDWKKAAEEAGLSPDSVLLKMLEAHAEMDLTDNDG